MKSASIRSGAIGGLGDAQVAADGSLVLQVVTYDPITGLPLAGSNTRLFTAGDQITIAGGNVVADCRLRDANGLDLQAISPTGGINQLRVNTNEASGIVANWNTQTIALASPQTYGLLDARHFRELVIVVNITAVNTAVTFSYQVQDGNSTLVTVWSESFASTGIQYICVGPGYTAGTGRNMSLGVVGQLTVAAVGTNATIKGSAWMRS